MSQMMINILHINRRCKPPAVDQIPETYCQSVGRYLIIYLFSLEQYSYGLEIRRGLWI
jgi:hypothetical protein